MGISVSRVFELFRSLNAKFDRPLCDIYRITIHKRVSELSFIIIIFLISIYFYVF